MWVIRWPPGIPLYLLSGEYTETQTLRVQRNIFAGDVFYVGHRWLNSPVPLA